ncbi:MAG: hypothetical protein KDJ22_17015, partial [Candidatus Competibacteraceae bacterium]|nr:hypothetical protein [Candidatus Competibacteraceae bacterium]
MKTLLAMSVAILLFGAGVGLAPALQLWLTHFNLSPPSSMERVPGGGVTASPERKPIKYRHPMNPTIFSDTPAKDDMGMDYIPVYADDDGGSSAGPGFAIAPEVVNNLGGRTARVERGA